ncbi:MAG: hypothetical protein AB8F65_07110 [Woeseiaceae bacterium]
MNPFTGLSNQSSVVCLPQLDSATLLPFLQADCPDYQITPVDASAFDHQLAEAAKAYAAVCAVGSGQPVPTDRWYCAIDPVFFRADMRDVQLHSWPVDKLTGDHAQTLRQALMALIRDDPDQRVAAWHLDELAAQRWIVSTPVDNALQFDAAPAIDLLGLPLRASKPTGDDASVIQRLMTEIQMSFHQIVDGTGVPVNGVWFYGAGTLTAPDELCALPTLYSDRLLVRGFWRVYGDGSAAVYENDPSDTLQPGAVWAPREVPDLAAWINRSLQKGALEAVVIHTANARLIVKRRYTVRQLFSRLRRMTKRNA